MTQIDFTFRPLDTWPGTMTDDNERKMRPFRSTYSESLQLLKYELARLGATAAVIQVAIAADEIRQDNMPRATAKPRHPGVIISFESKHGPLQYTCDDCRVWQDNIHAIALTLERLRLAEIYGVAKRGEQYKGWTQLPAPGAIAPEFRDREDAATWIMEASGLKNTTTPLLSNSFAGTDTRREILRAAARNCHPDTGGSADRFKKLQRAKEMLGL